MKRYCDYLFLTFKRLDVGWYCVLAAVLAVSLMIGGVLIKKRKADPIKALLGAGFVSYCAFIFIGAIFSRTPTQAFRLALNLVSNVRACFSGDFTAQIETIANILLFLPFGILTLLIEKDRYSLTTRILLTGLSALCLSLIVEGVQFITGRGLFETADIMNNVAGAAIGMGVACLGTHIYYQSKEEKND